MSETVFQERNGCEPFTLSAQRPRVLATIPVSTKDSSMKTMRQRSVADMLVPRCQHLVGMQILRTELSCVGGMACSGARPRNPRQTWA
jgi:hypothetical protein